MVRGQSEMSLPTRSWAMSMGWRRLYFIEVYLKFSIAKKEEKGGIGENERGDEREGREGEEGEEEEREMGGMKSE